MRYGISHLSHSPSLLLHLAIWRSSISAVLEWIGKASLRWSCGPWHTFAVLGLGSLAYYGAQSAGARRWGKSISLSHDTGIVVRHHGLQDTLWFCSHLVHLRQPVAVYGGVRGGPLFATLWSILNQLWSPLWYVAIPVVVHSEPVVVLSLIHI